MASSLLRDKLKLKISIENTDTVSDDEGQNENVPVTEVEKSDAEVDSEDDDVEFNVRLDKNLETEAVKNEVKIDTRNATNKTDRKAKHESESSDSESDESGSDSDSDGSSNSSESDAESKKSLKHDRVKNIQNHEIGNTVDENIDETEDDVEFNVRLSNYVKKEPEKKKPIEQHDDVEKPFEKVVIPPKVYKNKVQEFITGLSQSNEEIKAKRTGRAKRFGIDVSKETGFVDVKYLYKSLDIKEEDLTDETLGYRLDTVHMMGVDNLSTEQVFSYFRDIPATTIEWINDTSCNVVWVDQQNCARALYRLSRDRDEINAIAKMTADRKMRRQQEGDDKTDSDKEPETRPIDTVPDDYDELDLEDKPHCPMDVDDGEVKADDKKDEVTADDKKDDVTADNAKTDPAKMDSSEQVAKLDTTKSDDTNTDMAIDQTQPNHTNTDDRNTTIKPNDVATDEAKSDNQKLPVVGDTSTVVAEKTADTETSIVEESFEIHSGRDDSLLQTKDTEQMDTDETDAVPHHDITSDLQLFRVMNLLSLSWPMGAWRLGVPWPRTKALFMRFAMKDDVKLAGAEKRSEYYKHYGNPNYNGMVGLISKSKKNRIFGQKLQAIKDEADLEAGGRTVTDYSDNIFDDAPSESETKLIYDEPAPEEKEITETPAVPDRLDDLRKELESSREQRKRKLQTDKKVKNNPSDDRRRTDDKRLDEDRRPTGDRRLNDDRGSESDSRGSLSDSDERDELERLLGRSRTKRFMRMHADDMDTKLVSSNQLGLKLDKRQLTVTAKSRSSLQNRLGGGGGNARTNLPSGLQSRLGRRN